MPLPLHTRFPALTEVVPHIPFTAGATPVQRAFGNGWIKRDDASAGHYGGNKPRKLEFLLADARKQGSARIFTIGGTGSNHCLATTLHGRAHGFEVEQVDEVPASGNAVSDNAVWIFHRRETPLISQDF